jgi:hypothetical protein
MEPPVDAVGSVFFEPFLHPGPALRGSPAEQTAVDEKQRIRRTVPPPLPSVICLLLPDRIGSTAPAWGPACVPIV